MGIKISSINLNEFAQSVSSECEQQFLPTPYKVLDDLIFPYILDYCSLSLPADSSSGCQQTSAPILTTQLPISSVS